MGQIIRSLTKLSVCGHSYGRTVSVFGEIICAVFCIDSIRRYNPVPIPVFYPTVKCNAVSMGRSKQSSN